MDFQKISSYVEEHRKEYLEELGTLIEIESVSADPSRKGEMVRCAEAISRMMREAGIEHVKLFETDGNPLVYGEHLHAEGGPTVLVYAHYDVQPVDPLEEWKTPPFTATVRGEDLYARGSSDDKGQLFMHLKAFEALKNLSPDVPLNLKYIFEGEEEIGSVHLEPFIREHGDLLAADVVVISDTAMYGRDIPTICYGLRGMAYLELTVENAPIDLHSGSFGGAVENPVHVLSDIIASLHDKYGRVTVPHFYDDVEEVPLKERDEIARLPYTDAEFLRQSGVVAVNGEFGYSTNERLWIRPTLDVNGIYGGFTGQGAKTIIPSKATAKISMRLVPHQESAKILNLFESHIRQIAPPTVKVSVVKMHSGEPAITPIDHPAVRAASTALEQVFGKKTYFIREGGSIPEVLTFQETLGAPVVLLGFGLPDENSHAPNEHLYLRHFFDGIKTIALVYENLALVSQQG